MFVFTKYGALGASSRVRFLTYLALNLLPRDEIKINELFDDQYIKNLYSHKKSLIAIFCRYCLRFFTLFMVLFNKKYKTIWIEKELFPYIPLPFELLFTLFGKKVVYDFDDAVFHNYDKNRFSVLFKLKFEMLMKHADLVFVGNQYLYDHVTKMGAKKVKLIPTVIDLAAYNSQYLTYKEGHQPVEEVCIGWIGSPSTEKYLSIIDAVITQLQDELDINIRLKLIGASKDLILTSNVEIIQWTQDTEIQNICAFDIGIMPLFDSNFEKGKCGYKIIQYFACRKPVLASPVGVNCSIIKPGTNGFLCETHEEWYNHLKHLILDKSLREKLGVKGFELIKGHYTYQAQYLNIVTELKLL